MGRTPLTRALNTIVVDNMGRFPVKLCRGNSYIMLAHHVGANAIFIQPFKSKSDAHQISAYNAITERMKALGLSANLHVLDNEASAAYIDCITNKWECNHQKVPPDMHWPNIAKRMIPAFKAHFFSMLAGINPRFPVTRWDLPLHQEEITINLLCTLQFDPTKSAWELMFGPFNYNATPLGPPGCYIIINAKGTTWRTWDFKGLEGFYIGPEMNHYRSYTLLGNSTQAIVVSYTIIFWHHTLNLPVLTADDCITHCLRALTTAIRANNSPTRTDKQLRRQIITMTNKNNNKQRQLTMTADSNQQQQRRPTTMTNNNTVWVINKKTIKWKLVFSIDVRNLETMNNNDWQWQQLATTTKMNKVEKWWWPTTTNNDDGDNQQWRQTSTTISNAIFLSLTELQANS